MKRRTYALLLTLALSASLLTACAPKGEENGSSTSGSTSSSQSAPDLSAPDISTPDMSAPDLSAPDGSAPDSSNPDASAPDTSSPDGSAPEEAVPPQQPPVDTKPTLTLDLTDFTLFKAGDSYTLKATLSNVDQGTKVTFTSGDESVATVDENGKVTAVAPGTAKITATAGDLKATCIVRCKFEADAPASGDGSAQPGDGSQPETPATPETDSVDLAAFYSTVSSSYTGLGSLSLLDSSTVENTFPGLSAVSTNQCLVYGTMMSMNMGEIALVEVADSKDVDTVKGIFQARISHMAGDETNPGAAWYPEPIRIWTENSRVVSNGNYVMMVVGEDCDSVVSSFNALF